MMALDTGKDKIKKICDILKNETLEPAKKEARSIVEGAQEEAQKIIREAEEKAKQLLQKGASQLEKERALFDTSIRSAAKQAKEALRQEIESQLFNSELSGWIEQNTADPAVGARLIQTLVEGIEKEGLSVDFSAYVPANIPAEQINAKLLANIVEKLREKAVVVGEFAGGVQLKLHDKQITLDLSEEALLELLGKYIRKNFRELLFQ